MRLPMGIDCLLEYIHGMLAGSISHTTESKDHRLLPGPDVIRTELLEISMDTERRMRDECYRVLSDEGGSMGESETPSPAKLSYMKRRATELLRV